MHRLVGTLLLSALPSLGMASGFCDVAKALDQGKPRGFEAERGRVVEDLGSIKVYDLKLAYLLPGVERRGDCEVELEGNDGELSCRVFLRGFSNEEIRTEVRKLAVVLGSCLGATVGGGSTGESGYSIRTRNGTWIVNPVFDKTIGGARIRLY